MLTRFGKVRVVYDYELEYRLPAGSTHSTKKTTMRQLMTEPSAHVVPAGASGSWIPRALESDLGMVFHFEIGPDSKFHWRWAHAAFDPELKTPFDDQFWCDICVDVEAMVGIGNLVFQDSDNPFASFGMIAGPKGVWDVLADQLDIVQFTSASGRLCVPSPVDASAKNEREWKQMASSALTVEALATEQGDTLVVLQGDNAWVRIPNFPSIDAIKDVYQKYLRDRSAITSSSSSSSSSIAAFRKGPRRDDDDSDRLMKRPMLT